MPDFPLLLPLLLPAVLDDAAPVVLEGAAVAPGQAGEEDDEDEVFLECDADPTPGLAPVLLPLPAPLPCTAGLLMAEARADPDLDDALEPAPEPLLPDVDPRDREDRDGGAEGRGRRRSGLRSGVARCGLFLISFLYPLAMKMMMRYAGTAQPWAQLLSHSFLKVTIMAFLNS